MAHLVVDRIRLVAVQLAGNPCQGARPIAMMHEESVFHLPLALPQPRYQNNSDLIFPSVPRAVCLLSSRENGFLLPACWAHSRPNLPGCSKVLQQQHLEFRRWGVRQCTWYIVSSAVKTCRADGNITHKKKLCCRISVWLHLLVSRSSVGLSHIKPRQPRQLWKLSAGLLVNVSQIGGRDTFAKQRPDSAVTQFPRHTHHCCSRLRICCLHDPRRSLASSGSASCITHAHMSSRHSHHDPQLLRGSCITTQEQLQKALLCDCPVETSLLFVAWQHR